MNNTTRQLLAEFLPERDRPENVMPYEVQREPGIDNVIFVLVRPKGSSRTLKIQATITRATEL